MASIISVGTEMLRRIFSKVEDKHTLRLVSKTFQGAVDSDVTGLEIKETPPPTKAQLNFLRTRVFPRLQSLRIAGAHVEIDLARFCDQLAILEFSSCELSDDAMRAMASVEWKITELDFSVCLFHCGPGVIAAFISHCPHLKILRMTRVREHEDDDLFFSVGGVDDILDAIATVDMPSLEVLDLSENDDRHYDTYFGESIAQNAHRWPLLKKLDLTGSLVISDIFALCEVELPRLEELDIGERGGVEYDQDMYEALRGAMETKWPQLKYLNIAGIEDDYDDRAICALLGGDVPFNNLLGLNLKHGYLSNDAGLLALAKAGSEGRLPAYETIDIHVDEDTAEETKEVLLATWPRVRTLDICLSSWDRQVSKAITSALMEQRFPALQTLCLDLGLHRTVYDLLEHFHVLPTLEKLKMSFSSYKESREDFLSTRGPECFPNLKYLQLGGRFITPEEFLKIYDAPWKKLEKIDCGIRQIVAWHRNMPPTLSIKY